MWIFVLWIFVLWISVLWIFVAVFNINEMSEPVSLAIVVNIVSAYCLLFLVAQLILKIVFGTLRGEERQHLKVSMISQNH